MSDMRDEDRFDAFLQREAAEYNRPPHAAPREEMWEVVARARAARRPAGGGSAIPLAGRRRPLRYAPWIGMAATLLLGVGLGRYALQRGPDATTGGAPSVETAQVPLPGTPGDLPAESVAVETAASTGIPVRDASARDVTLRSVGARTVAAGAGTQPGTPAAALPAGGPATSAYAMASREHITRAEALVAVVAAMPADPMMDSLMGLWARDVLTNTRLLLDSPAGEDPIRRRLLEDLETLLVQLVQRSGRSVEERDLIDRTLQRTQLLTRLRSSASGT